jgi:hypothetical protein
LFSGICVGVDTSNVSQLDTGVLTGRVTDIMGFPVDDALITVVYHVDVVHTGFSDENGFYKIDDICLCKCLKNVTCSKTGYNIVNVLIPINNLTVHDFVLI